jgi:peptidoglycan hydrolase-like protein with peptidoglycan-binding domain
VLEDLYEKPIANAKCKLTVDSQTFELTTDGEGKLEREIPKDAQKATLLIMDEQAPAYGFELEVKIGHLDPVDKISGQKARLNNLGYFAGEFDEKDQQQSGSGSGTDAGKNGKAAQTQNGSAGGPQPATETQEAQNTSSEDQDSTHDNEAQQQFRSAVEEFQCDHDLTVDGICGPTTQAKLKQVHGC